MKAYSKLNLTVLIMHHIYHNINIFFIYICLILKYFDSWRREVRCAFILALEGVLLYCLHLLTWCTLPKVLYFMPNVISSHINYAHTPFISPHST